MLLPTLISCLQCGHPLTERQSGVVGCDCGASCLEYRDGCYRLAAAQQPVVDAERAVRDRQASTYLQHAKFPTQVASVQSWLRGVSAAAAASSPATAGRPVALDLGCGPGPYTQLLLQAGYDVLAMDTSAASLEINADTCRQAAGAAETCFIQYDLNHLALRPASVDLVLMADFIQHLGGRQQRERLLREVASAMKPGARFYLSFFNLNFKHFLKGDVHGSFAGGAIRYERLTLRNMLVELPPELRVDATQPLNVFHAAGPDRLAALLPGVFWLARMAAISGVKVDVGALP